MREPPLRIPCPIALTRITPACAGTTCRDTCRNNWHEDHPRVCGNHFRKCPLLKDGVGSPPRVREPLVASAFVDDLFRITPACAGTTISRDAFDHVTQDHPRVCGNHCTNSSLVSAAMGSPPRVREPPSCLSRSSFRPRITPACAGTTPRLVGVTAERQDHPRVCGNHLIASPERLSVRGSPPRVREPQIKDPIKSAFLSRRLSKNIHFLRELKNQLRILQSSMRYFIRNTI